MHLSKIIEKRLKVDNVKSLKRMSRNNKLCVLTNCKFNIHLTIPLLPLLQRGIVITPHTAPQIEALKPLIQIYLKFCHKDS